jgi:hypothetical protein
LDEVEEGLLLGNMDAGKSINNTRKNGRRPRGGFTEQNLPTTSKCKKIVADHTWWFTE